MKFLGHCLLFVFSTFLGILAIILTGYVICDIWQWFIFPNTDIVLKHRTAYGFLFIIGLATSRYINNKTSENNYIELWITSVIWMFLIPLLSWLMAYILHCWI